MGLHLDPSQNQQYTPQIPIQPSWMNWKKKCKYSIKTVLLQNISRADPSFLIKKIALYNGSNSSIYPHLHFHHSIIFQNARNIDTSFLVTYYLKIDGPE